ncbi:MAG: response regulator [Bacteroidetes bacterium]|nr:MAG: response regulator [Bacteroidota bacterium]
MNEKRILLVEDNPDDIELVQIALSSKRIVNHLDVVTDGEAALSYLFYQGIYQNRSPRVHPTLILLDLQLPKVDGLEVLRQLRAHEATSMLPVVVFTSSNQEKDIRQSYEAGANSYIQKPVDADKFEKAIAELQLYWLILNEPPPDSGIPPQGY